MADANQVGDALELLRDAPPKSTRDYAAKIVNGESSALGEALRNTDQVLKMRDASIREPMNNILERSLLQVWRILLGTTQAYLNQVWRTNVFDFYKQTLAGMYPFDLQSIHDARFGDISQFFSGSGKLGAFLDLELKPFLVEGEAWEPRQWEGKGIEISKDARYALRSAAFFTKAFLPRGNNVGMIVEVTIERPMYSSDSPDFDQIYFTIGGEEALLNSKKDPKFPKRFGWPGSEPERGAGIRIIHEQMWPFGPEIVDSMSADGPWGFFRLLARAQRSETGSNAEYRYRWKFRNGIVVPCLIKAETTIYNPFSRALAVRFPDRLN